MMIVDVNVLQYSVNEDAENHEPVRSWLRWMGTRRWVCRGSSSWALFG